MKICVLSDLHLEFGEYVEKIPPCDVLVLAGDTVSANMEKDIFEVFPALTESYRPNISIAGNHEGYNGKVSDLDREYLNNYVEYIDNVRFICSTGWSRPTTRSWFGMNDQYIKGLTLPLVEAYSEEDWEFIARALNEPFDGKTVVVTHYLPTSRSIHPDYENSSLNPSFCAYEDRLIEKYQPALWIHGHTHHSFDYMYGETRVVCNPRGYVRLDGSVENENFDPNKIVEV